MSRSAPTAEGTIAQAFRIAGRRWAVAIAEGFQGIIHADGIIESDTIRESYKSVEYLDNRQAGKALVAVIIDEAAKDHFAPGQSVRFYRSNSN